MVGENVEVGVYHIIQLAMKMAKEQELDLVEISPKADPPVCKIIDYKKFYTTKRRSKRLLRQRRLKQLLKNLRFGPNTEEHDLNFKTKQCYQVFGRRLKSKAFVFFRGRSIVFKDQGEILLLKFAQAVEEYGVVEQMPKLEAAWSE